MQPVLLLLLEQIELTGVLTLHVLHVIRRLAQGIANIAQTVRVLQAEPHIPLGQAHYFLHDMLGELFGQRLIVAVHLIDMRQLSIQPTRLFILLDRFLLQVISLHPQPFLGAHLLAEQILGLRAFDLLFRQVLLGGDQSLRCFLQLVGAFTKRCLGVIVLLFDSLQILI